MVMFFTHHQAEQCINYDVLFRQAAARGPHTVMGGRHLRPGILKNHLLPFVIKSQLQVVSGHQPTQYQSPTPLLARKSASDSTPASVPEGMTGAPRNPKFQRAHQRHSHIESDKSHTPLRYTQFESELKHHPGKSWTFNLLQGILQPGYEGPRGRTESFISVHTPHHC